MAYVVVEDFNESFMRVYSEDSGIEQELSDFFQFAVPGAQFTPKYKARLWDGKIRLYNLQRKTLYKGLINYVIRYCAENGHELSVPDSFEPDKTIDPDEIEAYAKSLNFTDANRKPIEIRGYQIAAICEALTYRRRMILSPTGSGKSLIIYVIMRILADTGLKGIIIVPTTSLVEQMYADFEQYSVGNGWDVDLHCQKLYSGFSRDFKSDILITTWQSIYKQPKAWFRQFGYCFGDEAHQFKAQSLSGIMESMDEVVYKIGTTGTLDDAKVHKLVLEGLFGPVYQTATTRELMDTNYLSNLSIVGLVMKYPDAVRQDAKGLKYQEEMNLLTTMPDRNRFICNLAADQKGVTLVMFQYVQKQGKPLHEMIQRKLKGTGKTVYFIYGDVDPAERERIRREVIRSKGDVVMIVSYQTFQLGLNIPNITSIIFASPSKSKIRNLQSIGRGLRLNKGKLGCTLFDIADDLHWKSHNNITLSHAAERYKLYSEEQFRFRLVEVKLCNSPLLSS